MEQMSEEGRKNKREVLFSLSHEETDAREGDEDVMACSQRREE